MFNWQILNSFLIYFSISTIKSADAVLVEALTIAMFFYHTDLINAGGTECMHAVQ